MKYVKRLLCMALTVSLFGCNGIAGKPEEEKLPEVKMKPGTYTAEAVGFSYVEKVPVSVTVDETKITDIHVSKECSETTIMLESAINIVVPEILEKQSVRVDVSTGATLSSAAIKSGVEDCLQQALKAGGAEEGAIANFQKTVAKENAGKETTLEADVVVVGLGGAGMTAAISAAEQGLKVIGIEKADKIGGTTTVASTPMAVNPKRYQQEHNGGQDLVDKQDLRSAWLQYTTGADGQQDAKIENVDLLLDHSGEALDWLIYDHQFSFGVPHGGLTPTDKWVMVYDYGSKELLPNDRRITAQKMYEGLADSIKELGGEIYTGTEGTELIYDAKTKEVTGVKAVAKDGTSYTVNAKAVVLCTGGFAGNNDMVDTYISQNKYYDFSNKGGWKLYGSYQNDGKMIASAITVGAGTYNIDMPPMVHNTATPQIMNSFPVLPAEGVNPITGRPSTTSLNDVPQILVNASDSLAIGNDGRRFVNEAQMGMLGSWGNGNRFFSIWSASQLNQIRDNGFASPRVSRYLGQGGLAKNMPVPELYDAIDAAVELGIAYKADSIEDLAKQINVPAEELKKTIETYNSYCESGSDADYGKAAEFLKSIGEGPYYCFIGAPYCYATVGGLDVNQYLNVLDDSGNEIKGLYACGEDSIGTLMSNEKAYVTYGGAAQGWAITSGYMAGKFLGERLK